MPPLNSPKDKIADLKLSALTHAARISHLVNKTTIGPTSESPTSCEPDQTPIKRGSKPPISQNKWRTDVWRSVPFMTDEDDDDDTNVTTQGANRSIISLIDCKAATFKMALKLSEKTRALRVRQEIRDHHSKYDEISAMMEQMKVASNEHVLKEKRQNVLVQEEELIETVRRLDEEARHCEERTNQELQAHNRRMIELNNHLKRDEEVHECCEQIKSYKNMFIMLFERYVKTILQNQQQLTRFDEYAMYQGQFLERYESVINYVNSGHISQAEVDLLEQLCDEVKDVHRAVDEEIIHNAEQLEKVMAADKAEAAARMQQAAAELERQQQEAVELQKTVAQQVEHVQQPPLPTLSAQLDAVDSTNKALAIQTFVSAERLQSYEQIMAFYEQYAQSVKPLQADENMKKYRFNCQKAVNIPLNTISAVSPQHLQDKFDKLSLLLSGSTVRVADVNISSSDHPLGVRFCTLLVAKKLVNQADSIVSSNPQSAFPVASIMVAIWQKFPDTGYLFLAYLYKECPYLVPYFIPQLQGQTTEEYLKLLGYRYIDGYLEKQDQYLKRMSGMIRLYSSILVSETRRGQTAPHPHGISNGWVWLTNVLNLDPLPDICATVIQEFLLIAGAEMWKTYGKQFHKLLLVIKNQYMVRLNAVDAGGPKARLEVLINDILKDSYIKSPPDILQPNFW